METPKPHPPGLQIEKSEAQPEPASVASLPKKRRRAVILIVLIGSLLAVGLVLLGWYWWALQPVSLSPNSQIVDYRSGESVEQLATDLERKKLIRSSTVFTIHATLTGQRRSLQAGNYEIKPSQSTPEIVTMVAEGKIAANQLLLAEGETMFELKAKLVKLGIPASEVDAALKATYNAPAASQRPAGSSLEGYLFPDTYTLTKPYNAQQIIQQMVDNFETQLAQTDYVQKWAAEGLSVHQALTLASIVEREVRSDTDRAMVAQLYLNRIRIGMMLQADPTAIYAAELAGKPTEPINLKIDSPYNTYKVKGLPPGPIGNPGLSAMKAVANPTPNDYLYFISAKDGTTYFAKTYEEHQKNIDRYLK